MKKILEERKRFSVVEKIKEILNERDFGNMKNMFGYNILILTSDLS